MQVSEIYKNSGEPLFVERESNNRYISIIVPVYNVESYLRECLDSIVGQTYPLLDIIVVNDGSTDGSGAICDEYAERDSRIRVVHKNNGGLSSARNAGLELVKGEFIAFVDSDDYLLPNAMELCMEKFMSYPEVDLIRFAFEEFYEDGQVYVVSSIDIGDQILTSDEGFTWWMRGEAEHCVWGAIYRTRLIGNLRFLEGVYAEDLEFMLRLFIDYRFSLVFIKEVLYRYRINGNSISQSKYIAMIEDAFSFWEGALEKLKKEAPHKANQLTYSLFHHMRVLENKHREKRTNGEELHQLQELFAPTYDLIKKNKIDWSLSPHPIKHFVYWHFPKLWRLLRPRDWGVESIRK